MSKLVSLYSDTVSAFVPEPTTPLVTPSVIPDPIFEYVYSDLNQYSPSHYVKVVDLDSVFQSVGNILSTPKYTRLFNPEFGSSIMDLLFEPMDEITVIQLYDAAIEAIERWETRVIVLPEYSEVVPFYEDNLYEISIALEVIGLPDTYTYSGTLVRGLTSA